MFDGMNEALAAVARPKAFGRLDFPNGVVVEGAMDQYSFNPDGTASVTFAVEKVYLHPDFQRWEDEGGAIN